MRTRSRAAARGRVALVVALALSFLAIFPASGSAASCAVVSPGVLSGDSVLLARAPGATEVEFAHGSSYTSLGTTTLSFAGYFVLEYDVTGQPDGYDTVSCRTVAGPPPTTTTTTGATTTTSGATTTTTGDTTTTTTGDTTTTSGATTTTTGDTTTTTTGDTTTTTGDTTTTTTGDTTTTEPTTDTTTTTTGDTTTTDGTGDTTTTDTTPDTTPSSDTTPSTDTTTDAEAAPDDVGVGVDGWSAPVPFAVHNTATPLPASAAPGTRGMSMGYSEGFLAPTDPGLQDIDVIASQGVKWIRLGENWSQVAPTPSAPSTWNWTTNSDGALAFAPLAARAHADGLKVIAVADGPPWWADAPGGLHYPSMAPNADFLHDQTAPDGSTIGGWESYIRGLIENGADAIAVGNEPNLYPSEGDNIDKQVALQRFTYDTVQAYDAANPGTSIPVISGALAGAGWASASDNFCTTNPTDLANPVNYLNAEFAAAPPAYNGAKVFAGSFDYVGINPFSIAPTTSATCPSTSWSGQYDPVARMKTLYDIEGANGSARPYWVTEFGANHNSFTGDNYSTIFNQYFNAFDGLRAEGVPIGVVMIYDIRSSNIQPFGTLGSDWTAWPTVSAPDPAAVIRAQAAQPYTPNDALSNYDKSTSAFDATTLDLRDTPTTTLAGDFDCDGYSDLLRYKAGGTNDDKLMWGNPSNVDGRWSPATFGTSFTYRNMNATATPVVGDFDGDGCDDILWYQPGTNKTVIWWGGPRANFGVTLRATRTVAAGYVPVAGDFDGDGRTDIMWYRPGNKATLIWWGAARSSFGITAPTKVSTSAGFTPVAGDYDGDHHADIAWYNRTTGAISVWWGAARAAFGTKITKKSTAAGYAPFSGDFNGDGLSDLFWYAPGASDSVWWGTVRTAFATAPHATPEVVNSTYDTATVGSFSAPYVHSKTKRPAVPGLGGEPETILWSRGG